MDFEEIYFWMSGIVWEGLGDGDGDGDGDGNGDGDGDRWTWRTEGRICKNGRSTVLAVPVPKLKPVVDVVVAEYQGLRLCAVSDAVPWCMLSPLLSLSSSPPLT